MMHRQALSVHKGKRDKCYLDLDRKVIHRLQVYSGNNEYIDHRHLAGTIVMKRHLVV